MQEEFCCGISSLPTWDEEATQERASFSLEAVKFNMNNMIFKYIGLLDQPNSVK